MPDRTSGELKPSDFANLRAIAGEALANLEVLVQRLAGAEYDALFQAREMDQQQAEGWNDGSDDAAIYDGRYSFTMSVDEGHALLAAPRAPEQPAPVATPEDSERTRLAEQLEALAWSWAELGNPSVLTVEERGNIRNLRDAAALLRAPVAPLGSQQEPEAWGVEWDRPLGMREVGRLFRSEGDAERCARGCCPEVKATVVPLYRRMSEVQPTPIENDE